MKDEHTAIPYWESTGFLQGSPSEVFYPYMLWQCTGFEGSNFIEIQGNICILLEIVGE
jgi:hypothetical protein